MGPVRVNLKLLRGKSLSFLTIVALSTGGALADDIFNINKTVESGVRTQRNDCGQIDREKHILPIPNSAIINGQQTEDYKWVRELIIKKSDPDSTEFAEFRCSASQTGAGSLLLSLHCVCDQKTGKIIKPDQVSIHVEKGDRVHATRIIAMPIHAERFCKNIRQGGLKEQIPSTEDDLVYVLFSPEKAKTTESFPEIIRRAEQVHIDKEAILIGYGGIATDPKPLRKWGKNILMRWNSAPIFAFLGYTADPKDESGKQRVPDGSSASADSGDSGGPILQDGKIVGVLSGGIDTTPLLPANTPGENMRQLTLAADLSNKRSHGFLLYARSKGAKFRFVGER